MADDPTTQPQFIAIASPKGGVGKTMTTILLACEFASVGLDVLIIDADVQASALGWYNRSKKANFPLRNIRIEPITDEKMLSERLRGLASDNNGADIVIIDVQGTANVAAAVAVIHSDLVIIPTKCHISDVNQCVVMVDFIQTSAGRGRPTPYRALLNMVTLTEQKTAGFLTAQALIAKQKIKTFHTVLGDRPTFKTVSTAGSLYETENPNKTVLDNQAITRCLMEEVFSLLNELTEGKAS